MGAQVMRASKDDDMLNEIVRMAYPQAKVFASNLPDIQLEKLQAFTPDGGTDEVVLRNPEVSFGIVGTYLSPHGLRIMCIFRLAAADVKRCANT